MQEQPAAAPLATAQAATTSRPTPTPKPVRRQTSESRVHIGFRLGGNSSTFGGVDASSVGEGVKLTRVTGFHGGVVFNFGGPSFSVQPEILYTQYGVRFTAGADYLQLKYNVVEVPVLLKATFGQPNLRVFINAGPVATYAINGTVSALESGQSGSQALDMTNEGRLAYGATGGLGIALQAGPGKVQLEGRYSYLVSGQNDGGSQTKPQNAMLSIAYLLPLGR
ncbi:porin family protein [Spirosoma knui]